MSTNMPVVRQTGGLAISGGPTVLGEKNVRIPTAGKIRPGIKVLTSAGAAKQGAKAAYDTGVAAGKDWAAIEKDIRKAAGMADNDKSPLTPKNVPYFTVRRADFTMPEIADRIMALYGEDRGDGRHLYRFPVVLPVDNWQAVLPHALKAYTRRELAYWSEYGADGIRYCMTRPTMTKDPKSQRFVRPFGGRHAELRLENEGRCDPEQCPQYQAQPQQCKLSGSFIFYIPEIPGSGAIELPMTSFYGLQGIRQQLELMSYARGRIAGTYNGQPMFWLSKRQDEVSMLDMETGGAKRVQQWITVLEGAVDMTKMLTAPEDDDDPVAAGEHAAAILEGPGAAIDHDEEEIVEGELVDDVPGDGNSDEPPTVAELQASIRSTVRGLRIPWPDYAPYADKKQGEGWRDDVVRLARVLDEVRSVAESNEEAWVAYAEKVEREGGF